MTERGIILRGVAIGISLCVLLAMTIFGMVKNPLIGLIAMSVIAIVVLLWLGIAISRHLSERGK